MLHLPACAGTVVDGMRLVILSGAAYAAAVLAVGEQLLPGGRAWTVLLIWVAAHVGGGVAKLAKLPPLLGMLLSGVVLVNLPGNLVEALPPTWSTALRAGALAIILTRCESAAPTVSTSCGICTLSDLPPLCFVS